MGSYIQCVVCFSITLCVNEKHIERRIIKIFITIEFFNEDKQRATSVPNQHNTQLKYAFT